MSRDELRLFSYEILGLVGTTGAGTHDLRRMVQRGRMLDWAGESQYYAEPKRLARLGYLEARKEPGKTRERTVYRLTEKGIDLAPVLFDLLVWGSRYEDTGYPCAAIEKMAENREAVLAEVRRRWREGDLTPFLPKITKRRQ